MLFISAVMFIPILLEYFQTGLVLDFPILIVGGFIVLAITNLFFAGLMLSTIVEKDRQAYEFRMHMIEREK